MAVNVTRDTIQKKNAKCHNEKKAENEQCFTSRSLPYSIT